MKKKVGIIKIIYGFMNIERYQWNILGDIKIIYTLSKTKICIFICFDTTLQSKRYPGISKTENIDILSWSANSPDLNPIEY